MVSRNAFWIFNSLMVVPRERLNNILYLCPSQHYVPERCVRKHMRVGTSYFLKKEIVIEIQHCTVSPWKLTLN